MNLRCLILLFFLFPLPPLSFLYTAEIVDAACAELCYLIPPSGWEIASTTSSSNVRVAFVKKTKGSFRPSLNLTTEQVNISPEKYLKAVQKLHEADHQTQWRYLGQIHTPHGTGELTELDVSAEWGDVRMLQLILFRNHIAYIVTAASLKKDFPDHYKDFYSVFQNIQFTNNLVDALTHPEQREQLQKAQASLTEAWKAALASSPQEPLRLFQSSKFQKKHWAPFHKIIEKKYGDMGAHWQFLIIKTTQEQLLRSVQ